MLISLFTIWQRYAKNLIIPIVLYKKGQNKEE